MAAEEKYKALEENEVRYEAIECDDADYVIVAFGSSARICSATVEMARAEGLKVGLLRPITLYPFPKKPLAELAARGVKGFLSPELNAGQVVRGDMFFANPSLKKAQLRVPQLLQLSQELSYAKAV